MNQRQDGTRGHRTAFKFFIITDDNTLITAAVQVCAPFRDILRRRWAIELTFDTLRSTAIDHILIAGKKRLSMREGH